MLFLSVLANAAQPAPLLPNKRSLQTFGPSAFTRLGWFRLTPIDQYSSLLPPVGVWSVSQYQCGGPSSQNPYPCLVGRYPANCLMERMPIHQRIAPFNKYHHVVPLFHRVLIHLSMACPRLMGRLHTRYSPVRRSPPGHCCPVMPLDLHVLSLPLAFILSQDQTLRCLFYSSIFSSSP